MLLYDDLCKREKKEAMPVGGGRGLQPSGDAHSRPGMLAIAGDVYNSR